MKNHVRNILEKLQLHSRMEAVMYAVSEKLARPAVSRRWSSAARRAAPTSRPPAESDRLGLERSLRSHSTSDGCRWPLSLAAWSR